MFPIYSYLRDVDFFGNDFEITALRFFINHIVVNDFIMR